MPSSVLIATRSTHYRLARSVDSTDATLPTRAVTKTEPSGDGVIDLSNQGVFGPGGLMIVPFGVGTAGQGFLFTVAGWRRLVVAGVTYWIPLQIGDFSCLLCAAVGSAGCIPDAGHKLVDVIGLNANTTTPGQSCEIVTPGSDIPGHIILNTKGMEKVELLFNMNGSATAANCLVALL